MKQTIIPAGYRLTITSWENDADHYKTKVLEGVTKEEAAFLVEFCQLYSSQNEPYSYGIGNMYEPSDEEVEQVRSSQFEVVSRHIETIKHSARFREQFIDENEQTYEEGFDIAYDLGLSGGAFFTRVCASVKVEYVPHDIIIEDVTEQFVKGK